MGTNWHSVLGAFPVGRIILNNSANYSWFLIVHGEPSNIKPHKPCLKWDWTVTVNLIVLLIPRGKKAKSNHQKLYLRMFSELPLRLNVGDQQAVFRAGYYWAWRNGIDAVVSLGLVSPSAGDQCVIPVIVLFLCRISSSSAESPCLDPWKHHQDRPQGNEMQGLWS